MQQKSINKGRQFIKFSIVGFSNTTISVLAYYILIKLGLNYTLSNILAYGIGMLNSYIFNKKWVFEAKNTTKTMGLRFVVLSICSLATSSFLLYLFISVIYLNKVLAQLIVTVTILIISFIGNKIWTFRKEDMPY